MASLAIDPQAVWTSLRNLSMRRLFFLIGSSVFTVVVLWLFFARLSTSDMSPLYQGMDPQDSAKIVETLNSAGITFEVRAGDLYVSSEDMLRARMLLAEAGVSAGGVVGYEVFDKTDILSTTNFVQQVNLLRALEGELARTIQTVQSVARARVHIVMPEKRLFVKEKRIPSAAVLLRMRRGKQLESGQIQAIRTLVASAVPDMKAERVSVLDDRGVLLASTHDGTGTKAPLALEEMRAVCEARLGRMIESLLERTLGVGNVRAEVNVEIDHDRVTEQMEHFDPDGQVVRSQQHANSQNKSGSMGQQATSIQQEMPNLQGSRGSGGAQTSGKKEESTVNYEISKTVKTAMREMGRIKRFSIAVLVDGQRTQDTSGKETYQERSAEELEKIRRLVKAAMGYQEERGDMVDVVNLKFHRPEENLEDSGSFWQSFSDKQRMRFIELGWMGLILLMLFLFGVRPALNKILAARAEAQKNALDRSESNQSTSQEAQDDTNASEKNSLEEGALEKELRGWEELPEDELTVLVNKFVQSDPERAASILRLWLKN